MEKLTERALAALEEYSRQQREANEKAAAQREAQDHERQARNLAAFLKEIGADAGEVGHEVEIDGVKLVGSFNSGVASAHWECPECGEELARHHIDSLIVLGDAIAMFRKHTCCTNEPELAPSAPRPQPDPAEYLRRVLVNGEPSENLPSVHAAGYLLEAERLHGIEDAIDAAVEELLTGLHRLEPRGGA
jgi:hypothetical protein